MRFFTVAVNRNERRVRHWIGLDNNEDNFSAFKGISAGYREGQLSPWEYISYVEQFGLMHLMLELARLCPDPQKQKELIDAYNDNIQNPGLRENGENDAESSKESKNRRKKGKRKHNDRVDETANAKNELSDSFRETVRKLQLNRMNQEENVEVSSKDGYRAASSVSKISPDVDLAGNSASFTQNSGGGVESSKQQKKASKFHGLRLGDDFARANASPEHCRGIE